MSDVPLLQFTAVGLAGMASASNSGIRAKITHIGVGTGKYVPTGLETQLQNELLPLRRTINDYQDSGDGVILAAVFDDFDELYIWEMGLFLEDGTLFALVSDPVRLMFYKHEGLTAVHVQELFLNTSVVPAESIEIVIGERSLNLLADNDHAIFATGLVRNGLEQMRISNRLFEITGEY